MRHPSSLLLFPLVLLNLAVPAFGIALFLYLFIAPLIAIHAEGSAATAPATVQADAADAEEPGAGTPERAANLAAVQKEFQERKSSASGNADLLVLPGILANRADRTAEVAVEATGIAPRAIVEFFLIGLESGHDYESLFVSFASAKDIDQALRFLGMTPGRNALARPMAFWPKGERVRMSLKRPDGSLIPLESLVFDLASPEKDATLPETGFVYCGSRDSVTAPGKLAADVDSEGPCSVASVYNEPTTLLDVPRLASQGEVYEKHLANPDPSMAKGAFLRLMLSPEPRSAERGPRVQDFTLAVRPAVDGAVEYAFLPAGATPSAWLGSAPLLDELKAAAKDHDPFVTVDFSDDLPCGAAATAAKMLSLVDAEGCIHVEFPRDGQLYYRAFLPHEEWRDRAKRPTQALELRFAPGPDGSFAATMVSIREIWPEDGESLTPELKTTETAAATPKEFAKLSAESGNDIPALLVFAPAAATLDETMPFVRAVLDRRPNVYFFVEK